MNSIKNIGSLLIVFLFAVSCTNNAVENIENHSGINIPDINKKDIVFITGKDSGDNMYYTHAASYFTSKHHLKVDGVSSLDGIIQWLNAHYSHTVHKDIHIVSHGNPWRGLSLKTIRDGERITLESLKEAQFSIPSYDIGDANIIFHSCGLGSNKTLAKALKAVLLKDKTNNMYVSPWYSVFGGKYAEHYMAQPFYSYYPTAHSKGPIFMANEFKEAYPNEEVDWLEVLKNRSENEKGGWYTYKMNIPVEWEFKFESAAAVPTLKDADAIMDWIVEDESLTAVLYSLQIPIEKFRWRAQKRENSLIIKGKSTALCALKPILDPSTDEYLKIDVENEQLYVAL